MPNNAKRKGAWSLTILSILGIHSLCSCTMLSLRSKNPEAIGAIAESSEQLAHMITSEVPASGPQKRILEVGAGTGVFTKKLIEKLQPGDQLDVVELMPELCAILDKEFKDQTQVTIFCGDILDWTPNQGYSYIVSGLPFNSFPSELVTKITNHLVRLANPDASCSFFEYKWLPAIRNIFMNDEEKLVFTATRTAITDFVKRYEKHNTSVFFNMPPALVHFLEIKKPSSV